jgi:hypothetical protein
MTSLSHIATARIEAPTRDVFAFLADPRRLGGWSLGCMETEPAGEPGVWRGRSLFDGARTHFHISADPETLRIAYHVGSATDRRPRIEARVVGPETCGLPPGTCYASLIAWRDAAMDEARWHRVCTTHETEVLLIKAQAEAARGTWT